MQTDELILVSVDDHLVEPPDLFMGRIPARYADVAPRVVTRDDGSQVWSLHGKEMPNIGLNAVAGRPAEEYGIDPTSFDEMRAGCYDVHERVRDMNSNGVLGSMCFPSFSGFTGQFYGRDSDRDLGLALLRIYNDWHIEEWCGAYPGRFIPLCVPPAWDPELMAAEVRRVAKSGCHAVTFSENPEKLGLPSFHDDHWDPFFTACADEGTIVCLHIGSSSQLVVTSVQAPIDVMIALTPLNSIQCAADLLFSPVLRKFPNLKFALSEGGIGWIPYFLERVDYVYHHHRAWTKQDFGDKLPSQVFRDHVVTCFIDDAAGLRIRDLVGVETICWECDYPHSDSTWPTAPEILTKSLAGLSDEDVAMITHENAMRHFSYDPFSVIPRTQSTVGKLREQARDVDVSIRGTGKVKSGPGTVAELQERVDVLRGRR
ncbi:MAG: amidohydrolase family protein [Acidimicrobiales bacterium]